MEMQRVSLAPSIPSHPQHTHLLYSYPFPAEDERSFLLDPSLQIRQSSFEGQPSFVWRSLHDSDSLSSPRSHSSDYSESGEEDSEADGAGELFEFIVDSDVVAKGTVDVFEVTLLQCMFERVRFFSPSLIEKALSGWITLWTKKTEIPKNTRSSDPCRHRQPSIQVCFPFSFTHVGIYP